MNDVETLSSPREIEEAHEIQMAGHIEYTVTMRQTMRSLRKL